MCVLRSSSEHGARSVNLAGPAGFVVFLDLFPMILLLDLGSSEDEDSVLRLTGVSPGLKPNGLDFLFTRPCCCRALHLFFLIRIPRLFSN